MWKLSGHFLWEKIREHTYNRRMSSFHVRISASLTSIILTQIFTCGLFWVLFVCVCVWTGRLFSNRLSQKGQKRKQSATRVLFGQNSLRSGSLLLWTSHNQLLLCTTGVRHCQITVPCTCVNDYESCKAQNKPADFTSIVFSRREIAWPAQIELQISLRAPTLKK